LNIARSVKRGGDTARLSNAVGVFGADDDSSVVWLLPVQSLEIYAIEREQRAPNFGCSRQQVFIGD
jgi:hypothetical protein